MLSESELDPMAEEKKELIKHLSVNKIEDNNGYDSSRSYLSDAEDDLYEKKDCWISVIIQLNAVSLVEQRFDIKCTFSVFWIDHKISSSDLKEMDLFREGAVNTGYELPLNPSNLFKNASLIEHIESPSIEFYDKSKNVILLKMVINASLHEHFELDEFPFDSQFLNIKIEYNIRHYSVLSKFPKEWIKTIETGGSGHYDRPLQIAKMDSITNWQMLTPWYMLCP